MDLQLTKKMKNLFSIMFTLCFGLLKAQDADMPHGKSTIFLYSGKTIKSVRLWHIDSLKVEYVLNNNLCDISVKNVSKIQTSAYLIIFDQEQKMVKKQYDLMILNSGDTLSGFIQNVDNWQIIYIPAGKEFPKSISKTSCKSYVQQQEKAANDSDISINTQATDENSNVTVPVSSEQLADVKTDPENFQNKNTNMLISVSDTSETTNLLNSEDDYETYRQSVAKQKAIKIATGFFTGIFYLLVCASRV